MIDFGLSRTFQPKERLHTRVGTVYYTAHEVWSENYDQSCDLWSAGVIMYVHTQSRLSPHEPHSTHACEVGPPIRSGGIRYWLIRDDGVCVMVCVGAYRYVLLSSYPPFDGDSDQEILRAVMRGKFQFPEPEWDVVSTLPHALIHSSRSMNPYKLAIEESVHKMLINLLS